MKLDHLESFLAVVRHGSLRGAAEALFVAQSTLTRRVRQLEADVGSELFARHSGGVVLTDAGVRFVPTAEAVVGRLRAFSRSLRDFPPLTIVAGKAFASYELPRLIAGFRAVRPTLRCYVRSALFPESREALLSGAADLAFLGHEVFHPAMEHISLGDDRIFLISSPVHPWARRFPGWADWGDQEVIAFGDPEAPFRVRVEQYLARRGVQANTVMELDSIHAVKRMVMRDLGVAFLPERTIREEIAAGRLAAHDASEGELTRPTWLAFLRERSGEPGIEGFTAWVRRHY